MKKAGDADGEIYARVLSGGVAALGALNVVRTGIAVQQSVEAKQAADDYRILSAVEGEDAVPQERAEEQPSAVTIAIQPPQGEQGDENNVTDQIEGEDLLGVAYHTMTA